MKSYKSSSQLNYEKEYRQKEKEIKEFNENLKKSELLNDELYVYENMSKIRLNLKQMPNKYLDNVLLMTEFFKSKRDIKNFKYIKEEILTNKLFLNNAINNNPEIYFIMKEEHKKIFKRKIISKEKEYLKYLSKEDYENIETIKNVSLNLFEFNESLSCITGEMFEKLLNGNYAEYVEKNILQLNLNQCKYLKENLRNYLEERKVKKSKVWFNTILNKNPYLYTVLNKEDYKDEENKEFIISLTGKYHDLFPHLPEDWRNDLEIITKIISDKSETAYYYQNHGMKYHPNVKDVALILNEYQFPEKFLEESFNNMSMVFLRKIYIYLTEEWRKQPLIIKSLFKERDDFEIDLEYCRKIPDVELAENLVIQLKSFKVKRLSEIGETLEKVVSYHYMKEKLTNKNIKEKKVKI